MDSESHFIVSLFQNGSYRAAISAFTALPSPSTTTLLFAARAHLALSPPATNDATALLEAIFPPTLDSRAVGALAQYLTGDDASAIDQLEELMTELGESGLSEDEEEEGRLVRAVVATAYILDGSEDRRDEAVEILREGIEIGHDQECLTVLSHLYLSLSLASHSQALLAAPATTAFTSDSLLSQLLLAKTSLLSGPTTKYQEAYYVFEEIKSMQGGRGEAVLNGLGASQAALGRWDEAAAAVGEAEELNPTHSTTLANIVALALHTGKTTAIADAAYAKLKLADPRHAMVLEMEASSSAFDVAAGKFGLAM